MQLGLGIVSLARSFSPEVTKVQPCDRSCKFVRDVRIRLSGFYLVMVEYVNKSVYT